MGRAARPPVQVGLPAAEHIGGSTNGADGAGFGSPRRSSGGRRLRFSQRSGILVGVSQQNQEHVRRIFDAFSQGDFHTALQDVRMEVRTHRIAPLPDPKAYQAPAGMLMAWGEWTAPFDEFELTVGEMIDAGESVVAEIRQSGRPKGGGAPVEQQFWFVCTFLDGELVQWDMLASKRQALKGVGMRDAPLNGGATGLA